MLSFQGDKRYLDIVRREGSWHWGGCRLCHVTLSAGTSQIEGDTMPLICRHNASQIVLQYQDGPALHCAATTRRLFIMLQRIIILIVFSFLGKFISNKSAQYLTVSAGRSVTSWGSSSGAPCSIELGNFDIDIHRYSQCNMQPWQQREGAILWDFSEYCAYQCTSMSKL